jgi:hypothetical protein
MWIPSQSTYNITNAYPEGVVTECKLVGQAYEPAGEKVKVKEAYDHNATTAYEVNGYIRHQNAIRLQSF